MLTQKEIIQKYQLKPSKKLGQNFLINKGIIEKMVQTVEKTDTIIEVGPGLGVITAALVQKANKVVAIEKDPKIATILKDIFQNQKNIEIIQEDARQIDLVWKNYKVIANIPYYLTSPLIRRFLEAECQPQEMILLIQKEVAQRICSRPPQMSILAVAVQLYGVPKIIASVSRNSFWPSPKVDSAILQISQISKPEIDTKKFFEIVRSGFSSPRKQLGSNLPKELLEKANIDPIRRAGTLSVEEWKGLLKQN